jgi:hypothetical protein
MTKGKLIVLVVFIAMLLISIFGLGVYFSSGMFKKQWANYTGYSTICIDGVEYIQFSSGASVKYNKEGKVELCH